MILNKWIFAVRTTEPRFFFPLFLSSLIIKMPELFKLNVPSWLNYAMTFTGITGLTGVVLLYMYQCKLIYPASFPEGSRQEVSKSSLSH